MAGTAGWGVIVVGGGNAALVAALTAADEGAKVLMLERAERPFRGGNTRRTRRVRSRHSSGIATRRRWSCSRRRRGCEWYANGRIGILLCTG